MQVSRKLQIITNKNNKNIKTNNYKQADYKQADTDCERCDELLKLLKILKNIGFKLTVISNYSNVKRELVPKSNWTYEEKFVGKWFVMAYLNNLTPPCWSGKFKVII